MPTEQELRSQLDSFLKDLDFLMREIQDKFTHYTKNPNDSNKNMLTDLYYKIRDFRNPDRLKYILDISHAISPVKERVQIRNFLQELELMQDKFEPRRPSYGP